MIYDIIFLQLKTIIYILHIDTYLLIQVDIYYTYFIFVMSMYFHTHPKRTVSYTIYKIIINIINFSEGLVYSVSVSPKQVIRCTAHLTNWPPGQNALCKAKESQKSSHLRPFIILDKQTRLAEMRISRPDIPGRKKKILSLTAV